MNNSDYDTEELNIIKYPEFDELDACVKRLRAELSLLVLERDELKYVQCKNIEMCYLIALGDSERRVFDTQCTMLRLKRKLEMIQMKKNRQEQVNLSQIDKSLDDEFADYKKTLDEHINKMNEAIERNKAEVMSDDDMAEFKKRYRHIVKELHPDLHANITDAQKRLLGNLDKLAIPAGIVTLVVSNIYLPDIVGLDNLLVLKKIFSHDEWMEFLKFMFGDDRTGGILTFMLSLVAIIFVLLVYVLPAVMVTFFIYGTDDSLKEHVDWKGLHRTVQNILQKLRTKTEDLYIKHKNEFYKKKVPQIIINLVCAVIYYVLFVVKF